MRTPPDLPLLPEGIYYDGNVPLGASQAGDNCRDQGISGREPVAFRVDALQNSRQRAPLYGRLREGHPEKLAFQRWLPLDVAGEEVVHRQRLEPQAHEKRLPP